MESAEIGFDSGGIAFDLDEISTAYDRMQKSEAKYRFVIDNASING